MELGWILVGCWSDFSGSLLDLGGSSRIDFAIIEGTFEVVDSF